MIVGLIMAGGRGERMRASGVERPKPLVPVAGVPLLEWNVRAYLRAGLQRIVVSVGEGEDEVEGFAEGRCRDLAASDDVQLDVYREPTPLGNIGCARELSGVDQTVLSTFADNLTTLDLRGLLAHHAGSGAALTLAAHHEPFRLPFGVLRIEGETVIGYDEKPDLPVLIGSGTAVLGARALAAIPEDAPCGLADLYRRVRAGHETVTAYLHDAPWIDVNDAEAVSRAEALVRTHPEAFAL